MQQHISIGASIWKDHDIKITDKWYQHEPETVMHNKDNNITIIYWPSYIDQTINNSEQTRHRSYKFGEFHPQTDWYDWSIR